MIHTIITPQFATVIVAGFIGGFVDSIAGGGGLITIPALLTTGLPPTVVLGTNKVAASFGSGTAAWRYGHAGHVQRIAWPMAAVAFATSLLGAKLALALPEHALHRIIIAALISVAVLMLLRRDFGKEAKPWPFGRHHYWAVASLSAAIIGFYDGMIGPGTGSFLAFAYVVFLGTDLISATANTKLVNFATNIAAATLFAIGGHVRWDYALIMGPCILIGAFVGSSTALHVGPRLIRPVFLVVVIFLVVKLMFV